MKMTEDQMLDVIEKLDARRLHEEPHEEKKRISSTDFTRS